SSHDRIVILVLPGKSCLLHNDRVVGMHDDAIVFGSQLAPQLAGRLSDHGWKVIDRVVCQPTVTAHALGVDNFHNISGFKCASHANETCRQERTVTHGDGFDGAVVNHNLAA